MKTMTRPTWMEIDLDNVVHNYRAIGKAVENDAEIMPIVKADAYGLGSVEIVKTLMNEGAKRFGVAHLSEALHIKKYVPKAEILIMGYTSIT